MIISTKGRYGVRAMFVLAQKYEEGPQSIKSISEAQHISETYLEQLFVTLRKCGLISSIRGAGGGYMLSFPPEKISVGSILEALEGPLAPADCVTGSCESAQECATHAMWLRIYDGISGVVNSITLRDMLDDYNAKALPDLTRCK